LSDLVISVRGLRKRYGAVEAVRGIDLEVRRGEIFAFLGPNGAGKTTTVEILEGHRDRDAGEVSVLGRDPARAGRDWNARVGVMLQTVQVQPELTVEESLEQFAGYYPQPRPVADTIDLVGLGEQRNVRAGRLSGGQQRRLDLGLALIGDPELLFMDEPTTGFDPGARRDAWATIAGLRALGKTIFLTTHYLDEAQRLADRVAIIAQGAIVATGPPGRLGGGVARTRIAFRLPAESSARDLPERLPGELTVDGDDVELWTDAPFHAVAALVDWARGRGAELADLEVRRQSLEDAYLELTAAE
jgi:ABC-2 type transport system ATP-binding protein